MKVLLGFFALVGLAAAVLAAAAAIVVYSGSYDVSATSGHTRLVEKTFNELMVRSVRAHARDIDSPVSMDFRDPALLERATGRYEAMCRTCHGAPGRKADPWLLYPPAPELGEALREKRWTDSEVFWIIKNGIKDTAMGAFGGSHPAAHSDEDIWGHDGPDPAILRTGARTVPRDGRGRAGEVARRSRRAAALGAVADGGAENRSADLGATAAQALAAGGTMRCGADRFGN
ncbi:MAG TPA: cytochrome c [Opitutaceae bacterium]|nr:cytochrome c [Opitutaceae bacterium]